jgi:hypothetical protein
MSVQLAFEIADPRLDDLSDLDFKAGSRRLEAERKRIARFELRHQAPACRCARPLPAADSDSDELRCARCGREVRP